MRDLGYIEGQSVEIEYRFADGDLGRLPSLARELSHLNPAVIFAAVTASAVAARTAAPGVPIVCPLLSGTEQLGLSRTDARPDQDVTGIRSWVDGLPTKLIEVAREIVPGAARLGVLVNATGLISPMAKELLAAGPSTGASLISAEVRATKDLDASFRRLVTEGAAVMIVPADSLFFAERHRIAKLAADARIPAICGIPEHVHAGGLASYGVDFIQNFRRAASFVDKILRGAQARDLPIEFPAKLVLAVNLKTARALGLDIPPTLLARADEVIE